MAGAGERRGQQLGNYRLLRLLGRGAFAEVYLGEHVHLGTQAAIKVLYAKVDNDGIATFRAEARTIAGLEHPSIVRVLDFGVDGNTPFLVMNYAPGGSLRTRFPRGTHLPLATVVSFVRQIASALQYAHERRLVHRDIKPENLLVGRHNEILLSDFGIALVAQSSRSLHPQDVAGTIAYMAPEQIQSYPRPASDQYSLGVVVYEWLGGEVPFQGAFTDIAVKHALVPPPSLLEKTPSLPPLVERVVFTALAKDPHQRYPTVQAFASALEQACEAGQQASQTFPMSESTAYPSWQSTFVKTPSEHAWPSTLLHTAPATPVSGPYASPATPFPAFSSSSASSMPRLTALQTTPLPDTNPPALSGTTPTLGAFTSSVNTSARERPRSFMQSTRFRVMLIAVVCLVLIAGFASAWLRVTGSSSPTRQTAKLVVDHSMLDFGKIEQGAKASLALGLSNTGAAPLNWTADLGKASWLSMQTNSGTIEPGSKTLVDLTIDTSSLPLVESSASLTITSNGGNAQVPLRVLVFHGPKEAILTVSTTSLQFGTVATSAQAAPQTVLVSDAGVLALNWTASIGTANWLTIDRTSGMIPSGGSPQPIDVKVNSGLATGGYSATLTISPRDGKPQSVGMSMIVGNAPGPQPSPSPTSPPQPQQAQMSLSATSLNFGSVPAGKTSSMLLVVRNTGAGSLNWTASTGGTAWVTLNPGSGTVAPAASQTITVMVNTQGLEQGDVIYSATLSMNSNGGNQQVAVHVTVTAATPTPVWVASTATSNIYSTAAVANGIVYAGSVDHSLYAWNASTGALVWKYTTGNDIYSSPTVVNGVVYFGSDDNKLYALDAGSGTALWSYTAGNQIRSSPTVDNGVVYVGSFDGNLYALDASSGAKKWNFLTGGMIQSSPAVYNGVVYIGSDDNKLYALDANTGLVLWSYATGGVVHSRPVVVNGVVYFGSEDHNFYALNNSNGTMIRSFPTGDSIQSSPVVSNGVVYTASDDGHLYALSANSGSQLWSVTTGSAIHSSPALYNGVIYIGSNDYKLYAVSAGSGAVLWTYATGFYVGAAPTVANGMVYIGSGDGKMYAFTAS